MNTRPFVGILFLLVSFGADIVLFAQQQGNKNLNSTGEGADIFIRACRYYGDNSDLYQTACFDCEVSQFPPLDNVFLKQKMVFVGNTHNHNWSKTVRNYPKDSPYILGGDPKSRDGSTHIILQQDGIVNGSISIVQMSSSLSTKISKGRQFVPDEVFHFGRVRGESVKRIISILNAEQFRSRSRFDFSKEAINYYKQLVAGSEQLGLSLFKCIGEEKYDDSFAKVLESRGPNGKLMQVLWIDPSKGYIVPLVKNFDEKTGNLMEEYKASQFFKDEKSGLWFPAYYENIQYSAADNYKTIYTKDIYKIDKDSFQLNSKIADEEFTVDIPEEMFVEDRRDEKDIIIYKAKHAGTLSLGEPKIKMDFAKMDWLDDISSTILTSKPGEPRTFLKEPKIEPKKDSFLYLSIRIVLTSLGAVMIVVAVIIMFRKKFRS